MTTRDKVLSGILGLLIVATIGATVYLNTSVLLGERFTEFYVLGPGRSAAGYPVELKVGDRGIVRVGIVNQEYEAMSYRVEVKMDGVKTDEVGPILLDNNQKWEEEISFMPSVAGQNRKVEFLLFKAGESEPYAVLYLWLDVTQ